MPFYVLADIKIKTVFLETQIIVSIGWPLGTSVCDTKDKKVTQLTGIIAVVWEWSVSWAEDASAWANATAAWRIIVRNVTRPPHNKAMEMALCGTLDHRSSIWPHMPDRSSSRTLAVNKHLSTRKTQTIAANRNYACHTSMWNARDRSVSQSISMLRPQTAFVLPSR